MHRLHEMQRDFSRYVFQETADLPYGIKANGLSTEQRLAIYRNNTRLGLTEVLRDVYPVINTLVGVAFFNRLAQAYLNAHSLQLACLLEFGGQFNELIAGFDATQGLAYLPDVALLEWFWHEAYHEADAGPLELTALAMLDPADYDRLGFRLHPSARLLASDYPIAQIWAGNQPDTQADTLIDLQQGGCRLLVYRPEFTAEILSLEQADYECLQALACGTAFTQVAEQVIAAHPNFDVQTRLQQWLRMRILTDFIIL